MVRPSPEIDPPRHRQAVPGRLLMLPWYTAQRLRSDDRSLLTAESREIRTHAKRSIRPGGERLQRVLLQRRGPAGPLLDRPIPLHRLACGGVLGIPRHARPDPEPGPALRRLQPDHPLPPVLLHLRRARL